MKFEIDVEIPQGYEPTGEYRYPRSGEPFLSPLEVMATTTSDPRGTGRRLILREKPLAYEDFEANWVAGVEVTVDHDGWVVFGRNGQVGVRPGDARGISAALIAAADHVDRVNQQNNAA